MGDVLSSSTVQSYDNCGVQLQEVEVVTDNGFDNGVTIAADKKNHIHNNNDSISKDDDNKSEIVNYVDCIGKSNDDGDGDINKIDGKVNDDETNVEGCKNKDGSDVHDEDDSNTFQYDVFISYSRRDLPWVREVLLQTLEQEGKTVCIDYRDLPAGKSIIENLVHAIVNSRCTILVLTPAFVKSEWCMFESKHALMSSMETLKARVLPLVLKACDIPKILEHLTYLDHTSEYVQQHFKTQLLQSLNMAKAWSPTVDQLTSGNIVPMSEVQDIVARKLEQKEEEKKAYKKLSCANTEFGKFINHLKSQIICMWIAFALSFLPKNIIFCILLLFVPFVVNWAFNCEAKCASRLRKWHFERKRVRESLGKTANKILDRTINLDKLFKEIEQENEKRTFTYEKSWLEFLLFPN